MRQITRDAAIAFRNHQGFKRDNTEVRGGQKYCDMFLHGNPIGQNVPDGIYLDNCAALCPDHRPTATTKERLNGILSAIGHPDRIVQRSGVWYLGDDVFPNNTWVKVK